jgi:hypothetical protein
VTTPTIHLGYAVGSGEAVEIPLKHLAVTGQTQESGKTTTLEALASRLDRPTLAFVTKRGEGSFAGGRRLQPHFRDRADWQFVDQLLEAQLREKNKFLRPWIMKVCRGTGTLAHVHAAVKVALQKAKGINEGVYTQLDAYLELIVPEIRRARLAPSIELRPGLNVMDVSDYATPMQMLFVQSAIDWVNDKEKGVVVIVPEAWEFIPEGRGSPVKASAVSLVRKGAGLGNFLWADSQDMAGVDKVVLRGCTVWLIGAQREANEIKRNLSNIPAGIARPKPQDIARLGRGEFYACWKDRTVLTYVQPAWMSVAQAEQVAIGALTAEVAARLSPRPAPPPPQPEPPPMPDPSTDGKLDRVIDLLDQFVRGGANAQAAAIAATPASPPSTGGQGLVHNSADEEALYQRIKARLVKEAPALLRVLTIKPELEVLVDRKTVTMDGDTAPGRVAKLLAEGFFDAAKRPGEVRTEMKRTGSDPGPRVSEYLTNLHTQGFLVKLTDRYQAVEGMKVNIVRK